MYIYDCIGKIVVLTRATVFGLEKRDLKPVRGGKGLGRTREPEPGPAHMATPHVAGHASCDTNLS